MSARHRSAAIAAAAALAVLATGCPRRAEAQVRDPSPANARAPSHATAPQAAEAAPAAPAAVQPEPAATATATLVPEPAPSPPSVPPAASAAPAGARAATAASPSGPAPPQSAPAEFPKPAAAAARPTPPQNAPAELPTPAAAAGLPTPAAARPADSRDADFLLDRALAAYEYGDMGEVIASAQPVADGDVPCTTRQRIDALRLLGIALFITNRPQGAETRFLALLGLAPSFPGLDRTRTRPDVVAFFENVRRRHASEVRRTFRQTTKKHFVLNLLPPLGQLQNHDYARAATFGGLEAVSLFGAWFTKRQLDGWEQPGHIFGSHTDDARTAKTLNAISVAVLAASWLVGFIDGAARYDSVPDDDVEKPNYGRATGPSGF